MHSTRFDQLVRSFFLTRSRRGFLAAAGGLLALAVRPTQANQLPATCGSTGQVCTLLYGCCSGLTCATSSINPSYGVCVPGEGGMVTSGTALVVPFDASDTAQAQTVSDSVTDTTTTTTTTTTAEDRQAEIDARKAERKARRDRVDTRQKTHKDNIEERRDTQKDRRQDEAEDADLADGPELELTIANAGVSNEYLQVRNIDSGNAVLHSIARTSDARYTELDTNAVTLQPGESFRFLSRISELTDTTYGWTSTPVCTTTEEGYLLLTSITSNGATTEFSISCSATTVTTNSATTSSSSSQNRRRKRKSRSNQQSRGKQKSRGKGK